MAEVGGYQFTAIHRTYRRPRLRPFLSQLKIATTYRITAVQGVAAASMQGLRGDEKRICHQLSAPLPFNGYGLVIEMPRLTSQYSHVH